MNPRMKMIFTVSVLLNVVLICAGLGMLYKFCQDVPIPGTMSPDARSFVARTYQNGREEVKPLIEEVKARRQKVESILTSDNFDRKSYDKAVDDLLETQGKIARHRADTMGKALTDLSDDDRKKFSKEIINGLTPGRPRHGKKHHDRDKKGEERQEEQKSKDQ